MNVSLRHLSLPLALALGATFALTTFAQQPAPPAEPSTPAATAVPAAPLPAPAVEQAAPPVQRATDNEAPLRRIDEPAGSSEETRATERDRRRDRDGGSSDFPFGNHSISKGSRRKEAVSVFGSTTVDGEVSGDAVSVFGNTTIKEGSRVGGGAVAVFGRLESHGRIREDAVSVLGGAIINGPVGGDAVTVLGNLHLGPKAVIEGDLVVVAGSVTKDAGAIIRGDEVGVPGFGIFRDLRWLSNWVTHCLFWGRLLAFGVDLTWAWAIAFAFLALYVLLALLFARPMERCLQTLDTRPGASIVASVLTVLLSPVVIVLLAITVIGALLIPFVTAGMFFASLFGKAVMLAWIGRCFTRFLGRGFLSHPVFAVLLGGVLVMLLYTIPVVGFFTYKLLSWLGLGVVVYTVALNLKREKPPQAPAPAGGVPSPVADIPGDSVTPTAAAASGVVAGSVASTPSASPGFTGPSMAATEAAASSPSSGFTGEPVSARMGSAPPPTPPPVYTPRPSYSNPQYASASGASVRPSVIPIATLPRATFFIRMAALFLDVVLIGIVVKAASHLLPGFMRMSEGPGGVLVALAIYGAVMWKTKGTTIGGIVCGLKVVRIDNRELDWPTAWVRALSCFLSLAVAGLGFIWIAIDDEKQSWHDKIAGTAVVRLPKGVSLV